MHKPFRFGGRWIGQALGVTSSWRSHAARRYSMVMIVATLVAGIAVVHPHAAAVAATPDPVMRQDQQEDIAIFRSEFLAVDRAYSAAARAVAERRLAALERTAGKTSSAAFSVEICRIVALADNGHSTCAVPGEGVGLSFSPLDDDFYVLKAAPENADLLGARLLAIDGRSLKRIRSALRSMAGGVAAHRDLLAAPVLVKPDLLHALNITRAAAAATFRLETLDGRIVERQLAINAQSPDWVSLQSEHAAWASQDIDEAFRWRDAPELDAVVVQLRLNMNRGSRNIAGFLEEAESAREQRGRKNIVLDMRWNVGGDFLQTRDFLLAWPQRMASPGRFFVLIGPSTFSAGIASVAYLKQAGQDRVILVGEPVGDRLMFFAENARSTRLPHSKIALIAALQRDDFKGGCRRYDDCLVVLAQPDAAHGTPLEKAAQMDALYGRRPLQIDSLEPDVHAPWTFQDFIAGRDPAIEAVATMHDRTKRSGD